MSPTVYLEQFILCLSGLSGSGKTTLVDALEAQNLCRRVRTTTTRPRREGEPEDAYNFVTSAEFESLIRTNALLEWQQYGQEFYGLSMKAVKKALKPYPHKAIAILGLPGVRAVKQKYPRVEAVWLDVDSSANTSMDIIADRMEARGDSADKISARVEQSWDEWWGARMSELYDHWVINADGKHARATAQLTKIIKTLGQETTSEGTVRQRPLYDAETGKRIPWSRVEASGYVSATRLRPIPDCLHMTPYPAMRWSDDRPMYVRVSGEWRRIRLRKQPGLDP